MTDTIYVGEIDTELCTYALKYGELPPGLTLTPEGVISGWPLSTGKYYAVVATSCKGIEYDTHQVIIEIKPNYGFLAAVMLVTVVMALLVDLLWRSRKSLT